jgi:pimeloyl-ACP methyl ester carboxylesterase
MDGFDTVARRFMIATAHPASFDQSFQGGTVMRLGSIRLVVFALLLLPSTALAQDTTPDSSPATTALIFDGQVDAGGGRTLHLACAGSGGPPVLLEWGGPNPDGAASAVIPQLGPDLAAALGTRFCAYDRAGTSQSAPEVSGVRTLREAASDLAAVLRSPELGCPCVVVGVSLGGAIAQVALAADATEFAGLVLLDAIYPDAFDDYLALAPKDASATAQWLDLARGNNPERLDMITNVPSLATAVQPPSIPIIVVTHGAGDPHRARTVRVRPTFQWRRSSRRGRPVKPIWRTPWVPG